VYVWLHRFLLYRRSVCVLCSHFHAHQNAVAKRNADFREIAGGLRFGDEHGQEDALPWLYDAAEHEEDPATPPAPGTPPPPRDAPSDRRNKRLSLGAEPQELGACACRLRGWVYSVHSGSHVRECVYETSRSAHLRVLSFGLPACKKTPGSGSVLCMEGLRRAR